MGKLGVLCRKKFYPGSSVPCLCSFALVICLNHWIAKEIPKELHLVWVLFLAPGPVLGICKSSELDFIPQGDS